MSEHKPETAQPLPPQVQAPGAPDRQRRKLATAGLMGAGVVMTVASRSALGAGFGQCGSESVSAALSRYGELASCGCSPGFWWQTLGVEKWSDPEIIPPQWGPERGFNEVFGVDLLRSDRPLIDLGPESEPLRPSDINNINCNSGDNNNLHDVIFHAIAALLNASFYGERFPSRYHYPEDVIGALQAAYHSVEDPCRELDQFKDDVDVYDADGGLWCFNGISGSESWAPY